MNDSPHTTDKVPSPADNRRAPDGAESQNIEQAINGLRAMFAQLDELSSSLRAWSGATLTLFLLELKLNAAAARQIVLCSIIFTLLSVLFVFSVCLAAGVVAYHITSHLVLSVGVFIVALALALAGIAWWQKRLSHFMGFNHTNDQLQEAWHAFTEKAQPDNADPADRG